MNNVSPLNYSLHLQNDFIEEHNEYWLVENDEVRVLSVCPSNSPSRSEYTLSKIEALKQYALMTTPIEGWSAHDANDDWHSFLENIE